MKVYCSKCKTELKKPIFGGYTRNDLGEFIPIWYVEPCPICSKPEPDIERKQNEIYL